MRSVVGVTPWTCGCQAVSAVASSSLATVASEEVQQCIAARLAVRRTRCAHFIFCFFLVCLVHSVAARCSWVGLLCCFYLSQPYPRKALESTHTARCKLPIRVAKLLHADPALVAPAVTAFYARDSLDNTVRCSTSGLRCPVLRLPDC